MSVARIKCFKSINNHLNDLMFTGANGFLLTRSSRTFASRNANKRTVPHEPWKTVTVSTIWTLDIQWTHGIWISAGPNTCSTFIELFSVSTFWPFETITRKNTSSSNGVSNIIFVAETTNFAVCGAEKILAIITTCLSTFISTIRPGFINWASRC